MSGVSCKTPSDSILKSTRRVMEGSHVRGIRGMSGPWWPNGPLPHKRGGQHIFTILRNFDLQFIENTSTKEFYGITIVKYPFMYKQKSRTWRRFVHRYRIIYGSNRNRFGNKICSRCDDVSWRRRQPPTFPFLLPRCLLFWQNFMSSKNQVVFPADIWFILL